MDRIRSGELPADLAFVLSNNSKSGALARARAFGAEAHHVSGFTEGGEEPAVRRMGEIIQASGIDLLVLAGYMKLVPPAIHALLKNRILNIHPALLPAFGGAGFYGHKVHEAVVERGCQYTGITIHMVNQAYDEGQIVLQRVVPVAPGSSPEAVAAEVLKREHVYYWQVVRAFALGEIRPTESDVPGRAVLLGRFLDSFPSLDL
ncbi:MAG: phosphoribosylglycinamide formyltransferase [Fibrobacteres bacterium]|nr:phosphoribosylglycinamide formyltransferase [Fibrobacterota bacterium]